MKKLIRTVNASIDIPDDIKDTLSDVKEDYDYLISGIEKLIRSNNVSDARDLLSSFSDTLQEYISKISNLI